MKLNTIIRVLFVVLRVNVQILWGHDYLVCECDNPDDYPNEAVCNNEADKES